MAWRCERRHQHYQRRHLLRADEGAGAREYRYRPECLDEQAAIVSIME